jgi:hypothetical protein
VDAAKSLTGQEIRAKLRVYVHWGKLAQNWGSGREILTAKSGVKGEAGVLAVAVGHWSMGNGSEEWGDKGDAATAAVVGHRRCQSRVRAYGEAAAVGQWL